VAWASRLSLPAGLRLFPDNLNAALRATLGAVVGVSLFVVALDQAFNAALPEGYRHFYTAPLYPRMFASCLGALKEELLYRLLLTTALAALPMLWGKSAGPKWMIAAIVLAQFANVQALVLEVPPWGALRFWLVGCTWGWLYWRHGLASAMVGHGAVHLLLDPLLLRVL
jgi:hypothetical protein